MLVAEATAKEDRPRQSRRGSHPRVAARWLLRYLNEALDDAAIVATSLSALTGRGGETAVETLRAMAEKSD